MHQTLDTKQGFFFKFLFTFYLALEEKLYSEPDKALHASSKINANLACITCIKRQETFKNKNGEDFHSTNIYLSCILVKDADTTLPQMTRVPRRRDAAIARAASR